MSLKIIISKKKVSPAAIPYRNRIKLKKRRQYILNSNFQSRHHKMFRRQFRHLYNQNDAVDLMYDEKFLDMNGYEYKTLVVEEGFKDTIFTNIPPEMFLQELGK